MSEIEDVKTVVSTNAVDCPTDAASPGSMAKPRRAWLWLSLILLCGFGIRVTGLKWGQAYCYGSQGDCLEAYAVAVDYGRGEARAQYLGQPNFNAHAKLPGPLWALFCLEGLRLGKGSIEGVVWVIILLNTGTIYLAYLLAARTIGYPAALWSALFMATSPQAVHYSVVVFNPVVMPFMGSLLFLALWKVTRQGGSKAIFWVFLFLLMMPQFHMSGLMLIPAVVVVLFLARVRVNVLWLAAGVLAGCCLYLPYLRGELAHNWQNSRGMFFGGRGGYSLEALKIVSAPLSFLVNLWAPQWAFTPAELREMYRSCFGTYSLSVATNAMSVVFAACLALGAFPEIREAMRGIRHSPRVAWVQSPGMVFQTIVFFVPLIVNLATGKPFRARYCLVLLAPLFSLAAAGATKWLATPRTRRLVLPVILFTTCANGWFMPVMYRFQGTIIQDGPRLIPGFHKLESVYQRLKTHAGEGRPVRVEVDNYVQALPPQEKLLHQAAGISRYVDIREKWNYMSDGMLSPPVKYRLCTVDQVRPDDPAVAYWDNGVALIAEAAPH